jgi:hypothetical protein
VLEVYLIITDVYVLPRDPISCRPASCGQRARAAGRHPNRIRSVLALSFPIHGVSNVIVVEWSRQRDGTCQRIYSLKTHDPSRSFLVLAALWHKSRKVCRVSLSNIRYFAE